MWEPLKTKKHGRAGLSKCSQSAVTQSEAQGKLGNVPSAESWHCWVYPQGAHRKQDAEAQSPTAHNRAREHQWGKPSYEGDRKASLGLPSPASNVSLRLPTITQAERTFPHFVRGPCCCAGPLAPLLWLVPSLTFVPLAGGEDAALPAPTREAGDHPEAWP